MHLSGITRFTLVDMTSNILENIERFVHQITFIDEERKILLNLLSDSIYEQLQQQKTISLAFICTHNSRRSHLAQMWFWLACQRFGLTNIECLSAGTEKTALNDRIVDSARRFGLTIQTKDRSTNPIYQLSSPLADQQLSLFSKKVEELPNSINKPMAIMVCDHASENCPYVNFKKVGHLHYVDPKYADDTIEESMVYDKTLQRIACEMIYLAEQLQQKVKKTDVH